MTPAQRVAAGAAWLDEHEPGWAVKIDLGLFQLGHPKRCICAQLRTGMDFWEFVDSRKIPDRKSERMGLLLTDDEADDLERSYAVLEAAWRDEINQRRSP